MEAFFNNCCHLLIICDKNALKGSIFDCLATLIIAINEETG